MAAPTVFSALADPSRLRIVALLRRLELSIGEVAQVLGQSQPRVSRHVKILTDAGIVRRRKEGVSVYLSLAASAFVVPLLALLDAMSGEDEDAELATDSARLSAIRAERAAQAEKWFEQHAEEWESIRRLHVGDDAVEAVLSTIVGKRPGRVIDIGTGTGRMLELFAPRADSAIGIDRSQEMLKIARAKLDGHDVELRQGDVTALPLSEASADTILLHHVLHFVSAPEQALAECARTLDSGGRLVIVDFAPHDREELRDEHAHARLGFSDEQIARWTRRAGLDLADPETLEGAELAIKIWTAAKPGTPAQKDIAA